MSFVLLTAAVYCWRFTAALFSIDDVFNVGDKCDTYNDDLDTMYSEALDLLTSAIQAVDDARNELSTNYEEGWRIMYTFFHGPNSNDYTLIRQWYSDVETFLEDGVSKGDKPWIFCGDDWAIRQNMDDQMHSSNGALATKSDGGIYRIRDNPNLVSFQEEATETEKGRAYPYWSEELGAYVFLRDFGQTDPTKGACNEVIIDAEGNEFERRGFTISAHGFLVLCPNSFTNIRLRQEAPSCIAASLYGTKPKPKAAQRLTDVVPEVSTFFHELFHLVLGNSRTIPAGGEKYALKDLLKTIDNEKALANVETYTMVAIGYDYTLNTDPINGHLVEYYTGFCTWEDGVAVA